MVLDEDLVMFTSWSFAILTITRVITQSLIGGSGQLKKELSSRGYLTTVQAWEYGITMFNYNSI